MSYKETKLTQRCPYNGFEECYYEQCPFFCTKVEEVGHFTDHLKWEYVDEITALECNRAKAEIRASEQVINNNVSISNNNSNKNTSVSQSYSSVF